MTSARFVTISLATPRWLWKFWPIKFVIIFSLFILITYWIPDYFRSFSIKYCGLFLQIIGIWTIVNDMSKRKELFNYPKFSDEIKMWWNQRPWNKSEGIVYDVKADIKIKADFEVEPDYQIPIAGEPVERRLSKLEENFNKSIKYFKRKFFYIEQKENQLWNRLSQKISENKGDSLKIKEKMEILGVGNIRSERMGVICLLLGTIMVTIYDDINYLSPIIRKIFSYLSAGGR